ncbi:TMEM175 family protein [Microbacterium sp.]|uniref:TMEM175 family protein n=1 Tax=Microbacterium sp. TaxID=51671 RepID=UPI003A90425E
MTDEHAVDTPADGPADALAAAFGSERVKAFIDAVVAIAMTLLILPLMESVSEADPAAGTLGWVEEHQAQLISFAISFAVIANFWVSHHRLFARVERVSNGLLWVSIGWLATIVWMPVATALTAVMPSSEPLVKIVYIGTMILTSLMALAQRLVLYRNPALHTIDEAGLRRGTAAEIATTVLFAVALVVSVVLPQVNYFALLVLFLTRPVATLVARLLRGRRAA